MFHRPHERVQITFPEKEGRTRQSEAAQADINNIMRAHGRDILKAHLDATGGRYGEIADYTNITDFHSALSRVREAESVFLTLPAELRNKFNNDPGAFIEYAENPDNLDGMRELGLVPPARQMQAEPAQAAPAADSEPSTGETGA